ncbi:MAG: hypothetical protein Fur0022_29760 [Anaerolineales bacterium]
MIRLSRPDEPFAAGDYSTYQYGEGAKVEGSKGQLEGFAEAQQVGDFSEAGWRDARE